MLQLRGDLNFPVETPAVNLDCQLGRQKLDDHPSAEQSVAGDEHATHPAAAELDVVGVGEKVLYSFFE